MGAPKNNIAQTGDRYYYRYQVGGVRRRIPLGKDRAEAERLAAELDHKALSETSRQQERTRFIKELPEHPNTRILCWDIETAPAIAYIWQLWNKAPLSHENLIRDWWIICASWKWLGDEEVDTVSVLDFPIDFDRDHTDDTRVIKRLHEVLSEADIIVHQNGDKFDLKKFNTRAIKHGMDPLPPIKTVDTLKVARKEFAFTSNRLDHLSTFLGVSTDGKMDTDFELWKRCSNGEREALEYMRTYNKVDVDLLEAVYLKLRPYMRNHPNVNLYQGTEYACPNCGSHNAHETTKNVQTRTNMYGAYVCMDCGAWSRDGKSKARAVLR